MWQSKKRLRALFDDELLKQTKPYEFYIKNKLEKNNIETGDEGEHENVPFICTEKIKTLSSDDTKTIYEYGNYQLVESKKGFSSEIERAEILTYAEKLNADLIYSDYDHVDSQGEKHSPFYKPDYSENTFRCFDMYSEFYAVKKEKSQMSLNELDNVAHVTKTLYHYKCENSIEETNKLHNIDNGRYLTDDIYVGKAKSISEKESISIIIPSKDNPPLVKTCLEGIAKSKVKSEINKLEVILVDNGSSEPNKDKISSVIKRITEVEPLCTKNDNDSENESEDLYESLTGLSIRYMYRPSDFNFSKMCNDGANASKGDYLLFLNDDIEITDELFLLKLLYFAKNDNIGAVGCKLLYPGEERRIQHTGITALKYAGPSHKLSTFPDNKAYYFGRNFGVHDCLAVTGACLMVSREKYFKIGGFHDKMKVGYNDVDLCVSLYEKGYLNLVNNDCVLIHHESVTRGHDSVSDEKLKRLDMERELLYERHPFIMEKGDPYYNPNLAEDFLDYRVDIIPDFERRDYKSKERKDIVFDSASLFTEEKASKNLYLNIEDIKKSGEFYDVRGWALVNKKKNFIFDTYLVCLSKVNNDEPFDFSEESDIISQIKRGSKEVVRVFETAKVYREDLKTVFPEAYNTELSGFFSRIPKDLYESEELSFGLLMINKQTGKKYYAGYNKSDI